MDIQVIKNILCLKLRYKKYLFTGSGDNTTTAGFIHRNLRLQVDAATMRFALAPRGSTRDFVTMKPDFGDARVALQSSTRNVTFDTVADST